MNTCSASSGLETELRFCYPIPTFQHYSSIECPPRIISEDNTIPGCTPCKLKGVNYNHIVEAHRILRPGGRLLIAEVHSRIETTCITLTPTSGQAQAQAQAQAPGVPKHPFVPHNHKLQRAHQVDFYHHL